MRVAVEQKIGARRLAGGRAQEGTEVEASPTQLQDGRNGINLYRANVLLRVLREAGVAAVEVDKDNTDSLGFVRFGSAADMDAAALIIPTVRLRDKLLLVKPVSGDRLRRTEAELARRGRLGRYLLRRHGLDYPGGRPA